MDFSSNNRLLKISKPEFRKYLYFLIFWVVLVCPSCTYLSPAINEIKQSDNIYYKRYIYFKKFLPFGYKKFEDLYAYDIDLYHNTRVWDLAIAVYEQDTSGIRKILLKKPEIVNDTSRRWGMTLLDWSVYNDRYLSAEQLLKSGANPDIVADQESPLIEAAGKETPIFINLLLKYGANVNVIGRGGLDLTPLERACSRNLENVKILVKAGANVNFANINSTNALYRACTMDKLEIVKYLIFEANADFDRPILFVNSGRDSGKSYYAIDYLREEDSTTRTLPKENVAKGYLDLSREIIRYIESHSKKK